MLRREILFQPERFPDGKFPAPLWKQSWSKVEPEIAATRAAWGSEINFESSQPPLDHALAGVWWRIGKQIGLVGIQPLYWIRFLNAALLAIVVWLAYVAARTIAPERVDVRIGVPLLVAFIPQNVFYAMNNDVLSPLCFGALFLCVLQWLRTNAPSFLLGALTGLAVAADAPDQAVQLAVRHSRACGDRGEIDCDHFTNTSRRADRACRVDFVRRNSGRHLDVLDKISFWRSHRIDSENWFARLDAKTVPRLVAASHFHAAWCLDFLVGFNRELLARGSQLA